MISKAIYDDKIIDSLSPKRVYIHVSKFVCDDGANRSSLPLMPQGDYAQPFQPEGRPDASESFDEP